MRRAPSLLVCLLCLTACAAGCKEDGTVLVRSITFTGAHRVDQVRLKSVLATRENTRVPVTGWQVPWGAPSVRASCALQVWWPSNCPPLNGCC